MTLHDLGSLGELLAAIATLLTLVYLAAQIRQNSKMLGETAKRATQAAVHQQNLLLFQDADALAIVSRGMIDRASLSREERVRFHNFWMTAFMNYQETFYQVRQLHVDDEWWRIVEKHLFLYLRGPGLLEWWQKNRDTFGHEFASFVDAGPPSRSAAKPREHPSPQTALTSALATEP